MCSKEANNWFKKLTVNELHVILIDLWNKKMTVEQKEEIFKKYSKKYGKRATVQHCILGF